MIFYIILKAIILVSGLVALLTGMAMLFFFEKFVKFNEFINQRLFVKRYETNVFKIDSFVFAKHYVMALVFIILGIFLLSVLMRY